MIRRWLSCGTIAVGVVAGAVLGCGDGEPTFNVATQYSPESLANELAFRYKELDPDRRNVPKPRPTAPARVSPKEAKAETKEAQATTLDDLVRETLAKARSIPGLSRTEAARRVAELVTKDASIAEADRKTIAERLQAEAGAKPAPID